MGPGFLCRREGQACRCEKHQKGRGCLFPHGHRGLVGAATVAPPPTWCRPAAARAGRRKDRNCQREEAGRRLVSRGLPAEREGSGGEKAERRRKRSHAVLLMLDASTQVGDPALYQHRHRARLSRPRVRTNAFRSPRRSGPALPRSSFPSRAARPVPCRSWSCRILPNLREVVFLATVARPIARKAHACRTSPVSIHRTIKPGLMETQDGARVGRVGGNADSGHRTRPVTAGIGTSGNAFSIPGASSRSDAGPGAGSGSSRRRARQTRRRCGPLPCRTPCMSRCPVIFRRFYIDAQEVAQRVAVPSPRVFGEPPFTRHPG